MAKPRKPTRQEVFLDNLMKEAKGREAKDALRKFAAAVEELTAFFGPFDAMKHFVKMGILITFAKEKETPQP